MNRLPKAQRLLWLAVTTFVLLAGSAHAAVDWDLYRTEDLPRMVKDAQTQVDKLQREQQARRKEIESLNAEIAKNRQRIGGNPKKNPEAAQAVADAEYRKKILEQKIAHFTPALQEKAQSLQSINAVYRNRQAELASLPSGNSSRWNSKQIKAASVVYTKLARRARHRYEYYTKLYASSAADVNETNRRDDYLKLLASEVRGLDQKLFALSNMQTERTVGAQPDTSGDDEFTATPTPALATPTPAPATPTPAWTPPPPRVTPTPIPEPPKDMMTRFFEFLQERLIFVLLSVFVAAAASFYGGIQIVDPENPRHHILSAVALAAAIALAFAIPLFGFLVGFVGLILAFWFYYQLEMDEIMNVLFPSVGIFLGVLAILLGLLYILLG